MHLEKMGRYNDALNAYQAALLQESDKNSQEQSQIYYRMGECLVHLNRIREAFNMFERAATVDSNNVAAQLRIGEFLLSAGAVERARDQAEALVRRNPRNSEAVALWGAAMEGLGEKEKAEQAYRDALSIDPNRVSVAITLADLYNNENKTKQAQEVLEESAKANPKNGAPLMSLARLHEQEGEITAAEGCYRRAVQAEDTAETNLRLAQFLQRTSRIAESEQVLRRVDTQRPAEPTALADFEFIAGRPTNALDSYEALLSSQIQRTKGKQSSVTLLQQRARIAARIVEADIDLASRQKDATQTAPLKRAHEHLNSCAHDVDAATLAILEAEAALAENNLALASEKASTAVALAPRSAPALYTQGVVRMRHNDLAEARAQWLSALESDRHFAPARLALAEQALRSGDARGAEEYVLPVVRDEPANLRAVMLFARILAAEKQYPSALVIARRAEALDDNSPDPHLLMGEIATDLHRPGEALIHYQQAVLLDPHSKDAVEGLTRLYDMGKITRPTLARIERVALAPPASATLLEITGRLYAQHGWYDDAKRCLAAALRFDPQRTTAAAALAKAFAATGNFGAATDSAERTGGNSATLLAGIKAQDRNDIATAIQNYESAVRGGEKSGIAANNLAWLYAQQGTNLARALDLAHTAQSLLPSDPAVLDTLGVVHLRLREYSEAVKALESAKQLGSRNAAGVELMAQIRQHLAEAYLRAGNTDAANAVEHE
jgi:tetratricopeptide (TPR) repeat protein